MRALDWLVVLVWVVWIVYDGLRRSKGTDKVEGYFLANRSLPWWAVGLSVMATQMSAVTMVGTTGQAYATGLRFVQLYFGLPLAMIILSLTVVPFFHRAKVYTAYEYLERRFDVRTRSLASFLFLMGRAFSLGVTLAAPAVVMSTILDWQLPVTVFAICVPMIIYTTIGGVQAVAWTDVKQMFIVVGGMAAAVGILIYGITREVSFGHALQLAGATGRLKAIDFKFDVRETYTFWSGMLGGLFLMLVVFRLRSKPGAAVPHGEVDRRSASVAPDERLRENSAAAADSDDRRAGVRLLPVSDAADALQPHLRRAGGGEPAGRRVRARSNAISAARLPRDATRPGATIATRFSPATRASGDIRARAAAIVKQATGDERYNDVNYVFPTFITTRMPIGLVGLMIAAIFAAAMSASGGELNALATATIIDFYRRHFVTQATDRHYLTASKLATISWGLFACVVAMFAANQGSLIEVVNRYGSLYYGSLLGVFILAILTKRATARGAFWGMIAGMTVVLTVAFSPWTSSIAFLWHNLIGAVVVVVVGMAISYMQKPDRIVATSVS